MYSFRTIPLADVVDCKLLPMTICTVLISLRCTTAFKIFYSAQVAQGLLGAPSKQQLDTVFGTHKDVEVVEFMLKNGREQASDGITSTGTLNVSRGSNQDSRAGRGI